MRILEARTTDDARRWQAFTEGLSAGEHYHRWGWKQVIENAFEWPTYFLMAEEAGEVCGVLPLVWQKSRLFGNFMTSLPFLNGGGIAASSREAEEALLARSIELAKSLGAKHIELRFRHKPNLALPVKTNKVAVTRPLAPDSEATFQGLPHKVRTDVRKAMKSGFAAEWLGQEALDDFYRIFAINMRELGTPAYGKNFFREILSAFPQNSAICLIRLHGKPVAASFLMGHRETIEAGWSASRYEYLALKPNVFLYWSIFCLAGEKGYRTFDFGRSSVDSGTYRFKMQWGSQETQLYWAYWLPEGAELPELNPQNPRYRLAIKVWSQLPVALTKALGPPISRCLP
ncbi:MAG: FemAB family XrtA/PEP-CTERM system-associated protein [Terriglobia bacterium]|jgi:FemAB-related protein (PEP-CTERM system-associated)